MNFHRSRKATTISTSKEPQQPQRRISSLVTKRMCRSPIPEKQDSRTTLGSLSNHSRSSIARSSHSSRTGILGMLRRPSWGLGLGRKNRRIQDPALRESVLPRRPACLHLPSQKCSGSLPRKPDPLGTGSDHSQQNQSWDFSNDGQPKRKKTKIKFLDELQNEPLITRDAVLSETEKWKALDDLIDMANKIRVTHEFDWEKLLEEDEEVDSDFESPTTTPLSSPKPHITYEKPSIHLHRCGERDRPIIGPGVLLH